MKLIGYVRLSLDEAKENQHKQLENYCSLYNFQLLDIVEVRDGEDPATANPETRGNHIVSCVKRHRAEGIVMQRLERFFPRDADWLVVAMRLRQQGLTIHVIDDWINTARLTGWLGIALKAYLGHYPVATRSTAEALDVAPVIPDPSDYAVPFGCIRIGSTLFRDPNVWLIREKVMHLYRREGIAVEEIISRLQSQGIASPCDRSRWTVADIVGLLRYHDILAKLPLFREDGQP